MAGRKPHRLAYFRERWSVPRSTDRYDDVIEDDRIDAVLVATPPAHHLHWAERALAAGKHLLIEKPLAADPARASAFADAVATSDRTRMIATPVETIARKKFTADAELRSYLSCLRRPWPEGSAPTTRFTSTPAHPRKTARWSHW